MAALVALAVSMFVLNQVHINHESFSRAQLGTMALFVTFLVFPAQTSNYFYVMNRYAMWRGSEDNDDNHEDNKFEPTRQQNRK